jgi:hypothetical protein
LNALKSDHPAPTVKSSFSPRMAANDPPRFDI